MGPGGHIIIGIIAYIAAIACILAFFRAAALGDTARHDPLDSRANGDPSFIPVHAPEITDVE
jgi:hypothetical protein